MVCYIHKANQITRCRDMAIFEVFKMASGRHLGFYKQEMAPFDPPTSKAPS